VLAADAETERKAAEKLAKEEAERARVEAERLAKIAEREKKEKEANGMRQLSLSLYLLFRANFLQEYILAVALTLEIS
jgi:hypothetical protein